MSFGIFSTHPWAIWKEWQVKKLSTRAFLYSAQKSLQLLSPAMLLQPHSLLGCYCGISLFYCMLLIWLYIKTALLILYLSCKPSEL